MQDYLVATRVRRKAAAYCGILLRRMRIFSMEEFADMVDDAEEQGVISEDERLELFWADVVVKGKSIKSGEEMWVVIDACRVVEEEDVRKVKKKAEILQKIVGETVVPVVVGREFAVPEQEIEKMGVVAIPECD